MEIKKINEFYKDFNLQRTYIDNVFDFLVDIICEVNNISEKDFTNIDNIKSYLEKYFDNNKEILLEIDKMKDKRYQFIAETIYDKHFNSKDIEIER